MYTGFRYSGFVDVGGAHVAAGKTIDWDNAMGPVTEPTILKLLRGSTSADKIVQV